VKFKAVIYYKDKDGNFVQGPTVPLSALSEKDARFQASKIQEREERKHGKGNVRVEVVQE
jgi:hypothetical protein